MLPPQSGKYTYVVSVTDVPSPTKVSATAGVGQATINWAPPASDGRGPATSYTVGNNAGQLVTLPASATSHTFTGLANGTSYPLWVSATNEDGSSAVVTATATTAALPAPKSVSATPGKGKATVKWAPPGGVVPVTGYTVTTQDGQKANLPASARYFTFRALTNGEKYTLSVVATSVGGNSPVASVDVYPGAVAPAVPANVVGKPGDGQATLTWAPPANDGGSPITGYVVRNWDGHLIHLPADTTSWTATGLTNGTTYMFYVRAVNAAGISPSGGAWITPRA